MYFRRIHGHRNKRNCDNPDGRCKSYLGIADVGNGLVHTTPVIVQGIDGRAIRDRVAA